MSLHSLNIINPLILLQSGYGDFIMKKMVFLYAINLLVISLIATAGISSAAVNEGIQLTPVTISDSVTGCDYNYIDFNGKELLKPYAGMQAWTNDGKSFLCGHKTEGKNYGNLYLYNTETNVLTTIGSCLMDTSVEAVVGSDDCVYYVYKDNIKKYDIKKYNIKTKETTVLLPASFGFSPTTITVSNDCNYISFASNKSRYYDFEEGETGIFRYYIPEKRIDYFKHKFDVSNILNHHQINPADPDTVFFAHEGSIGDGEGQVPSYRNIYDRAWKVDFKTGEKENMFKQGKTNSGESIVFSTHESWGASGKYLYMNAYNVYSENGNGACAIRCYKDGSHREYLKNTHSYKNLSVDHSMATSDDKFTLIDSNSGKYVYLLSNDTYEQFPIYYSENGFIDMQTGANKEHPYHPHPNVARNHYKVIWGMEREGVVGIAWYDFTELSKKVSEGGHYSLNSYFDRVSYNGLDCESEEIVFEGKNCSYAGADKYLYYDIKENFLDGVNEKVILSFDYFDNSKEKIILSYTDGVLTDNDYADTLDASIEIKRNGTNKWIHKEIEIDSVNVENINPYRTDFRLGGTDVYIADMKLLNAVSGYCGGDGTKENPYKISNADELFWFAEQVNTTDDKTEVESQLSYTATKVNDANTTATYIQKRFHVFTDKYFELTADIDLDNREWTPIGDLVNTFNGHFNGNGYVVSNININGKTAKLWRRNAFFGATGADAQITNLGLSNLVCKFKGNINEFTVKINDEDYKIKDRYVGAAGFVAVYAGGVFKNCYIKNATVTDVAQQMNSGGTGAFFGVGYATMKADEENGYNAMKAYNCFVNGATVRAHSTAYGFIGPDIKPNSTSELSATNSFIVTKYLSNCYSANIKRGYYSSALGESAREKAYDGELYPFSSTTRNITFDNCYTTSMGEKTNIKASSGGNKYTYSVAAINDIVLETSDLQTLCEGIVDNENFYRDSVNLNGGYPVYIDKSDSIRWDGISDRKPIGDGTKENPYLISDKEELLWFKNSVNTVSEEGISNGYVNCADAYFKLTNDIDFENYDWEPVGNKNSVFNGHFDGNGHVIRNIKIQSFEMNFKDVYRTASETVKSSICTDKIYRYNGFFGITGKDSLIENLGLENIKINFWNHDYYYNLSINKNDVLVSYKSHRSAYSGAMVGFAQGQIRGCYVKNSEVKNMLRDKKDSNVGGFVGFVGEGAKISGCFVKDIKLCASYYSLMCGFVGSASLNSEFSNCYASGVREDIHFASNKEKETTIYSFGFAEKDANVINCVSDLKDYQAQTENSKAYNSEYSIGTYAQTKDEIIALADYENLAPDNFDENINDGYPICLWQMSQKAKQKFDADSFVMEEKINEDLPHFIGKFNSAVSWIASDSEIINEKGEVTFSDSDKVVTLQAKTEDGYITKPFTVIVGGKVPFENHSFNVTKDGENSSGFVCDGVIDKVSFYKNRAVGDCYMYTVLYDKSANNRMVALSVDFLDEEKYAAKNMHTIELSNPLKLSGDTDRYILKLIFTDSKTDLMPVCKAFVYSE